MTAFACSILITELIPQLFQCRRWDLANMKARPDSTRGLANLALSFRASYIAYTGPKNQISCARLQARHNGCEFSPQPVLRDLT